MRDPFRRYSRKPPSDWWELIFAYGGMALVIALALRMAWLLAMWIHGLMFA